MPLLGPPQGAQPLGRLLGLPARSLERLGGQAQPLLGGG
jgi:hypothetical protein